MGLGVSHSLLDYDQHTVPFASAAEQKIREWVEANPPKGISHQTTMSVAAPQVAHLPPSLTGAVGDLRHVVGSDYGAPGLSTLAEARMRAYYGDRARAVVSEVG